MGTTGCATPAALAALTASATWTGMASFAVDLAILVTFAAFSTVVTVGLAALAESLDVFTAAWAAA